MICPAMSEGTNFVNCRGSSCAWWEKESRQCGLLFLAVEVYNLRHYVRMLPHNLGVKGATNATLEGGQ